MSSFELHNFGCRASQADGAAISALLENHGLTAAEGESSPEFVILNTCTVTAAADSDAQAAIRRAHRAHPAARIVVTGCYAQRAPQEIATLPGVALVVGNSHKTRIAELLLDSAPYHGLVHVGAFDRSSEFLASPVEGAGTDRSRPNLKVQDGCSNRCTFCVIPSVRGPSRSASPEQVIQQVKFLSRSHAEIVLTGINLGRWGRESGGPSRLVHLLRRLLDETDISRLRLSSIEPMDLSDDLLSMLSSTGRIAQHVHAPLQSGSDALLRRMARKYRIRHYEDRLRKAQALMPDAAFGADVMAGFPGETEAELRETLAFIESQPLTYLHVFPYSERPGTAASTYASSVPVQVRRERVNRLQQLSAAKTSDFRRRMAGRTMSAVTLQDGLTALTTNYIQIQLAARREPRKIVDLVLGGSTGGGVLEAGALPVLAGG